MTAQEGALFSWRLSVAHYSHCASFVRASGANPRSAGRARSRLEARKEKPSSRPHSPSQLLRELLRLPPLQPAKGGGGRTRRRPPSRALLHAGGREGGGAGDPPLQSAGLRKILLGQWQAGRRALIGAGALLITVETRVAGNSGGCGARSGGSQRGEGRRRRGPELPWSFHRRQKSTAGGPRVGGGRGPLGDTRKSGVLLREGRGTG